MWANPRNCDNAAHCKDSEGSVGGNAHHGFALDWPEGSGQSWLLYHTRNLAVEKTQVTFSQRNVAIDRVYFSTDGLTIITPVTSTSNWVRQLKYVNPYETQSAVLMGPSTSVFLGSQQADEVDPLSGFRRFLWNITNSSYLSIKGVDFGDNGSGASSFTVRVASSLNGGVIEARLDDSFDGALIATIIVPNTGGENAFTNVSTSTVVGASGVHDLYLIFLGSVSPPVNLFNMVSWRFDGSLVSGSVPPPVKVRVAIKSRVSGLFVTAPLNVSKPLVATSAGIGDWNRFFLYDNYEICILNLYLISFQEQIDMSIHFCIDLNLYNFH
jgi:hypothetical protein